MDQSCFVFIVKVFEFSLDCGVALPLLFSCDEGGIVDVLLAILVDGKEKIGGEPFGYKNMIINYRFEYICSFSIFIEYSTSPSQSEFSTIDCCLVVSL